MELKNVVPWGRSFQEYREIFNLSECDLDKYILGCGDGPASFNTELTLRGGRIISVDPIYLFSVNDLQERIAQVYEEIIPQAEKNREMYIWENIPSVEALGKLRMNTMNKFIADYETGKAEGRYIPESLPHLSFNDKHFDLALCSHYLFLYSEHVSLEQHIASIKELSRVSREVRIYPLISLNGEESRHLEEVILALSTTGMTYSIENVGYNFQHKGQFTASAI